MTMKNEVTLNHGEWMDDGWTVKTRDGKPSAHFEKTIAITENGPILITTEPDRDRREEDDSPHADDEDTGAHVAPIVKLEEVAVSTGEEDEDPILDL